jgi:hypothetical protein
MSQNFGMVVFVVVWGVMLDRKQDYVAKIGGVSGASLCGHATTYLFEKDKKARRVYIS